MSTNVQQYSTNESSLTESEHLFEQIQTIVAQSSLSPDHTRIISYDLDESQKSYQNKAYKSCVVMLGAALEGFMLGTLQRSDVINFFKSNKATIPMKIQNLGTQDPQFYNKIGNKLGFEEYKISLTELIDGIKDLGVDNIQSFRNAIHPWKCIQETNKYGAFDKARALHHISSFKKIIESIANWNP